MLKVFKYQIPIDGIFELKLPVGAHVLHVNQQGGPREFYLWALVNPEPMCPTEKRRFRFAGTGHPIRERVIKHINSFLMLDGQLVWHFFEIV